MVIVTPLTLKGTRSMMMMQQLQPEMRKIQTRYKDDRQKLNEELLKFYKENSINPLGGCLPLLVQMPVFLVLYQVLRGLTQRVSAMGFDVGWAANLAGGDTGITSPPDIVRQRVEHGVRTPGAAHRNDRLSSGHVMHGDIEWHKTGLDGSGGSACNNGHPHRKRAYYRKAPVGRQASGRARACAASARRSPIRRSSSTPAWPCGSPTRT